MLWLLVKKQLSEMFRSFFVDQKKGTAKSKVGTAVSMTFFLILMVGVFGGMFAMMAMEIYTPFSEAGVDWLYYTLMGLISLLLGVFGSAFNTFSGLYLAKDNDQLLCLPIPIRYIVAARLTTVYLMGLMYSAAVVIPTIAVALIEGGFSLQVLLGGIVFLLIVSVIVMILSCLLGWVIAKLSVKLKRKSYITVLLSIAFIALYYFLYFKAVETIQSLLQNAVMLGGAIQSSAYPLYLFGKVGTGDGLAIVICLAVVLAALALLLWGMSKNFLSIATATDNSAKKEYKETKTAQKSVEQAIYQKEFARLTSSANYLLNCGMGTIMMLIAAIALIWKGDFLYQNLRDLIEIAPGIFVVMVAAAIGALSGMNDMATPSISLEGKSLWIYQSLPIPTWTILKEKMMVQIRLTLIPALFLYIAIIRALHVEGTYARFLLVQIVASIVFYAEVDLMMGILKPSFNWTNELYPIKQSMVVLFALLVGVVYNMVLVGIGVAIGDNLNAALYLGIFTAVTALLDVGLLYWLKTKGVQRFLEL